MKTLKSILLLILPLVFISCKLMFAQEVKKLDKEPWPVGGIQGIMEKVVYPEEAKKNKVQGKVYVKAIINEKGDVEKVTIEKGENNLLEEAALKAIKATKFTPGELKGKKVKAEVVIPVMFKLG